MCNTISSILRIRRLCIFLTILTSLKTTYSKSIQRFEECESFFNSNDCYYFPCLETHFPCGSYAHLVRFSYDFCLLTTKKYVSRLSKDAGFYFNHTNQCAMRKIHEDLIEPTITGRFTCAHLQIMIFNIYLDCFQSAQRKTQLVHIIDFCSVICDDIQAIIDIFLNLKSDHIHLHRLLIETGSACGAIIDESITHTIPSILVSICLDRKNVRLEGDITQIMLNQRYEANDYEWI